MRDRIEEIRFALDEKLSEIEKKFITLRTANKLLWDKRLITEFERDRGFLKSLLEQKKLNATQTQSQPRQWRIYSSKYSSEPLPSESEKPAEKKQIENKKDSKKERKKWDFGLILGITGILALIFFGTRSHNNIEEQNAPYKNNPSEIESPESKEATVPSTRQEATSSIQNTNSSSNPISSSNNIHTFKSTSNDKERNGQILQTSSELMFHTINLDNNTVTHKFQIDAKWKEITYPFSGYYKEEGSFYTTMVLQVGVKGVKEIWWTPEVNNLGYDFDDGNRLVSYDLERITD